MKKIILFSVSAFLLSAAIVGWYKYRAHPSALPSDTVYVQAAKVTEATLPLEMHALGTLVARSVEITPEVAGHVDTILFQDGSDVAQSAPLIQLDNAVAKSRYDSTRAKLAYSENDYKRKLLLGKQGAIAQQAIDQAEADVKEQRAAAREMEVMVNKMQLTAPFAGVASKSKVNPGDYVTVGQSLLTLTDTKHLRIEYNAPEKYLPSIKLGQAVKITSTTYPDQVFLGKVAYIAPTINTDNRSVALYADINNEKNQLAPGMYVEVEQALGKEENTILIPARALVPILDGEQVFKVVAGKAYPVTVLIGRRVGERVQILQGLAKGDIIITDGQLKVKNGSAVTFDLSARTT